MDNCLSGSTGVIIAVSIWFGQVCVSSLVNCSNGAHVAYQTCDKAFIH